VEVSDLEALLGAQGADLLAELNEPESYREDAALALATRLRSRYPAQLVSAALTQRRLRGRAEAKFGPAASSMYFTAPGLEQSTRLAVAELRAGRYARAGVRRVADLCCGIGGDALAFAAAGIEVVAIDRDPVTCAIAAANARAAGLECLIHVHCADVHTALSDSGEGGVADCDAVFLDPARRTARGRVFDPDAYSPPWGFALSLAERFPATGIKAAPGLPHEVIPQDTEAEWVSDRGEVKEAALYFGPLADPATGQAAGALPPHARRATLLPGPHTLVSEGAADPEPRSVGRYLYEPDGSVIRARVIGELARILDAATIDRTIAYLTSDRLTATPFATAYEVTDVLPFHVKQLRRLLAERGVRSITVKKRGADIDPAVLRKQLLPNARATRGAAGGSAVVIVTRVLGAHSAILAQPVVPEH
jgi:SAM-dependent methyltransferase